MESWVIFPVVCMHHFQSENKHVSFICTQHLKALNENLDKFLLYKVSTISEFLSEGIFLYNFWKTMF